MFLLCCGFVYSLMISLSFLGCWKCEGHITSAEGQTFLKIRNKTWRYQSNNPIPFFRAFLSCNSYPIWHKQLNIVVSYSFYLKLFVHLVRCMINCKYKTVINIIFQIDDSTRALSIKRYLQAEERKTPQNVYDIWSKTDQNGNTIYRSSPFLCSHKSG